MVTIRLAQNSDIAACWDHHKRLSAESGQQGDFIFSPIEGESGESFEEFEASSKNRWQKTLAETNWERCWIVADQDKVLGSIHLVHRPPMKTSLHRATLMMGIERSHRKQGLGPRLMTHAVDWARSQPSLEWVQLFVFEGNTPAKNLYRKFGFVETGTVPDMFRVFGNQVDDTTMVLKLK
jgi:RimJ/RimL family protein N-acetyltransferase